MILSEGQIMCQIYAYDMINLKYVTIVNLFLFYKSEKVLSEVYATINRNLL